MLGKHKNNKTIEDVKRARIKLESSITKLLKGFEKDYGVKTGYMSINRKGDSDRMEPSRKKPGVITNVDINLDFDIL